MELNIETKQQLEKLLAKPALVTQEHIPLLQNLVKAYPYYQLLYLLLAKASSGSENQEQIFTKAALYNNGNILHRTINEPTQLKAIEEINVITYQPWANNLEIHITTETAEIAVAIVEDVPSIENLARLQHEIIDKDSTGKDIEEVEEAATISTEVEQPIKETFVPEIENLEPLPHEVIAEELTEKVEEAETISTEVEQPEKETFVPEIENLEPLPHEVITEELTEKVEEAETISTEGEQPEKETFVPEIENLEPLPYEVITEELTEKVEEAATISTEEEQPIKETFVHEIENLEPLPHEVIAEELTEKVEEAATITAKAHQPIDKNFIVPEIENLEPLQSEVIKVCEPKIVAEENLPTEETDEQETFEEIGELVMPNDFLIEAPEKETEEAPTLPAETTKEETIEFTIPENTSLHEINLAEEEPEALKKVSNVKAQSNTTDETSENDFIIESIASTDFFAFDKNFSAETISEQDDQEEVKPLASITYTKTENIVSKYNDDDLPFTFLWWLTKTRKDHEQIFKPFVSPVVKPIAPTTDLQQQYVEHIFHIQPPLETNIAVEEISSEQKALSKEDKLIDNFIKNEPQIKVPKPDQINNENKAKKSSEDNYDLVSETLAEIYIEQMLYHKAIDTYQKLSLKFPEKSRYFADLIQSLEKKI